jgi:hypothetical protein
MNQAERIAVQAAIARIDEYCIARGTYGRLLGEAVEILEPLTHAPTETKPVEIPAEKVLEPKELNER